MKFKVYFAVTRFAAFDAHPGFWEESREEHFQHVATIEADSLEDAFTKTQNGSHPGDFEPEGWVGQPYAKRAEVQEYHHRAGKPQHESDFQAKRYAELRSASVGDVLIAEDGTATMIDRIGFRTL